LAVIGASQQGVDSRNLGNGFIGNAGTPIKQKNNNDDSGSIEYALHFSSIADTGINVAFY
jgi:hypothetical protein